MQAGRRAMLLPLHLLAATRALATSTATARCVIAGGKAHLFKKQASPIVYSKAIGQVQGEPKAGGVVDVVDGAGGLIGWGVFNPHSMYRVRLLVTDELDLLAHRDVGAVLRRRLTAAAQLREACGLPSAQTTAYRLVNSEGDRISGLTVDVFGGTAVAVTSALWVEQWREDVMAALGELPGVDEVVWRRSDGRLQQDGWDIERKRDASSESAPEAASEGERGTGSASGKDEKVESQQVEVMESGLRYLVSPARGQKSGFYCDQRENRRLLADVCAGRTVLDLFCYSGGFAISAAAAGATKCVGVDSSAYALELAQKNAELNGLAETCDFLQADVHRYLKGAGGGEDGGRERTGGKSDGGGVQESFDVVVCDPPKLAPSVKDLPRATRKYRELNAGAIRATKPGGLLLSCSCSAAMTQSGGFVRVLHEAAQAEGRTLTVLRSAGAAPDHVLHPGAPEGAYLSAVLVHVA